MQDLPRTGIGVLVVVFAALTLSACAGGCGAECEDKMAILSSAAEANAAAAEAANQAAAANSAMIAENADGDAELRRLVETRDGDGRAEPRRAAHAEREGRPHVRDHVAEVGADARSYLLRA